MTKDKVGVKIMMPSSNIVPMARELSIYKKLNHPNIAKYIDGFFEYIEGTAVSRFWLVSEYCALGNVHALANSTTREEGCPESWICYICMQIFLGLNFMHRNNFIHLDVKGKNVVITDIGQIKLIDFGCAKSFSTTETIFTHKSKRKFRYAVQRC